MNANKVRCMGIAATLALGLLPFQPAFAEDIYTYNATDDYVWVTIYDVTKSIHMDWGWVAPHAGRAWSGGGSPTPMSYLPGSFYYVRGEVKANGPYNTPNIFDTTVEVDQPLAIVPAKSSGLIVCIAPQNGNAKAFYWDNDDQCIQVTDPNSPWRNWLTGNVVRSPSPAPVRSVKEVPLQPTPHPHPAVVKLAAADVQAPFGRNSAVHHVDITVDGKKQPAALAALGKWSTPTPEVIEITDKTGGFRVLKAGTGLVTWTYADKTYDAKVRAQ